MRVPIQRCRLRPGFSLLLAASLLPAVTGAAETRAVELPAVLEQVQAERERAESALAEREAAFQARLEAARARVAQAEATVAAR